MPKAPGDVTVFVFGQAGLREGIQSHGFTAIAVDSADDLERRLSSAVAEGTYALVMDARERPSEARRVRERLSVSANGAVRAIVEINAAAGIDERDASFERQRCLYRAAGAMQISDIAALVARASDLSVADRWEAKNVGVELDTLLVQDSLEEATLYLERQLRASSTADHVRCLFHDTSSDSLRTVTNRTVCPASRGITGYVVRTGDPVYVDKPLDDPRYDVIADSAGAMLDGPMLAIPLSANAGGLCFGVVLCGWHSGRPPARASSLPELEAWIDAAAPVLHVLSLRDSLQRRETTNDHADIFDETAIAKHSRGWKYEGRLWPTPPVWMRCADWAVAISVLVGIAALVTTKVTTTVAFPAVIRAAARYDVVPGARGRIQSIEIAAGDHAKKGQTLFKLSPETAEADESAAWEVRSPSDGLVKNVTVHVGQIAGPEERLAQVIDERGGYTVDGAVPTNYQRLVKRLASADFVVDGYEDVVLTATPVSIVDDRDERAMNLSTSTASQPELYLRGRIGSPDFNSNRGRHAFEEDMPAHLTLRMSSTRLLSAVFPTSRLLK